MQHTHYNYCTIISTTDKSKLKTLIDAPALRLDKEDLEQLDEVGQ